MMTTLDHGCDCDMRIGIINLLRVLYIDKRCPIDSINRIHTILRKNSGGGTKRSVLEFWDLIIWEQFKEQDMIDGTFPDNLDEKEIQRRLYKILMSLSKFGCLNGLIEALKDDYDSEFLEKVVKVMKKFTDVLKKHNILHEPRVSLLLASEEFSNEVDTVRTKVFEFLDIVQRTDFDMLIKNRKDWMSAMDSFESLLDDMLSCSNNAEEISVNSNEEDDDNSYNDLDCY